jgi:hypothetical protein
MTTAPGLIILETSDEISAAKAYREAEKSEKTASAMHQAAILSGNPDRIQARWDELEAAIVVRKSAETLYRSIVGDATGAVVYRPRS